MKKISIVIPCFNESESTHIFYKNICGVLNQLKNKFNFEIIFIDDGSSDDTLQKLIKITLKDERFKLLELSRNFGKEAALTAGLAYSTGDALIVIDADLQDPTYLIPSMIDHWVRGADVVLAKRTDRGTDTFIKRATAKLFYKFYNLISPVKIPEDVGDFRLMDKAVIDVINLMPEKNRFMKGIFAWVGFKSITIEYKRESRAMGKTKFSGWRLWNLAIEGITSFSSIPLRVWSYVGIIGSLFSIFYGCVIIFKTLVLGIDVPGYASLLVSILFIGSLQLMGLGILGEYIGRIYEETKRRPSYVVRKMYGFKK